MAKPLENDSSVKSLSGEILDVDLKEFVNTSRELRGQYYEAFMDMEGARSLSRTNVPFSPKRIFVTKAEREEFDKISNKTIIEIKSMIEIKLIDIKDEELRAEFETMRLNELQKSSITKAVLIHFYQELMKCCKEKMNILILRCFPYIKPTN